MLKEKPHYWRLANRPTPCIITQHNSCEICE